MDEQVMAVLGPHHGLGLAALAPDGAGNWAAIPCEGGHSDLPVTTDREWQVYRVLKDKHGHVAREFVISMTGLVELFQALNTVDGLETLANTPEEVIALANIGDAVALEAIAMCTGWLAAMASDVALMLGARGGIYLTGDLMDLLGDLFDSRVFCKRYAEKGRLTDFVIDIPVYQTQARDLEIVGLATLFD
jgi:glucokinase